ncbi:MAG: 50S ribosomal protein L29 [Eubacteriales bacterium]|nr:50S ribosomal protein L29 [Eubacteriales bacterium]
MKPEKLREMTDADLLQQEKELKAELFNLRFQTVTGQIANPNRIAECRKDIARIKTILRQREMAADAE